MRAIISTTYDSKYLFFLPICIWAWNRLGVDVICFSPRLNKPNEKANLIGRVLIENNLKCDRYFFDAPEHKEATYAQCSRLYGACLDLPLDEVLVTSDIDMAVFRLPAYKESSVITITGRDLVPSGQVPMCYLAATVGNWRERFEINKRSYQECLDDLLGNIEAEHFRGNFWSKDQEEAFNKIYRDENENGIMKSYVLRTNGQNQFATKRLDRDDAYILERDTTDIIDYHLNRPGYEHIETILTIFSKIYPNENFDWIRDYNEAYKKLL